MNKFSPFALLLLLAICLVSCDKSQETNKDNSTLNEEGSQSTASPSENSGERRPNPDFPKTSDGQDYLVTLSTSFGEMKLVLFDQTPKHKENFLALVYDSYYDDLLFHRVIQQFMIQGGDPNSKNASPDTPLGAGDLGYTVPAEFDSTLFHRKGALAAARQPDRVNPQRASSACQFYIVQGTVQEVSSLINDREQVFQAWQEYIQMESNASIAQQYSTLQNEENYQAMNQMIIDAIPDMEKALELRLRPAQERVDAYTTTGGFPPLDDQYTVFGQVVEGLEVIDKIAAVKTLRGDRPEEDVKMQITAEIMDKADIISTYGFEY